MINLIPIKEKKEIKKDFYYRFLIVSFFMLVFLGFISLIAMLPAYFTSLEKKNSINQKLNIQKNEVMPQIDQSAQIAIKDLETRLVLLEKSRQNKYVFSEKVVREVIPLKIAGIKINSIFYENDLTEGRKVSITGFAQSREQLLLFRKALENNSLFKNVDLPISNFVKGRDIEFSLNFISI